MRKKGFTLIELLAVIIILAILMIIAVPNILSTLATARSSAFINQAQSIYKSAEQQYVIDTMSGTASTCYDKSNLNLGSVSSTISFTVQMNSSAGTVSSLTITDIGQQLTASGTTINNITLGTYNSSALSCSGSGSGSESSQTPTTYTEALLNGADPVLAGDLVPVVITQATGGNDFIVTKADTTEEWYKYGDSEWANAVRLVASPSGSYSAGDEIAHSDISAYFVWIPKYKYKIFNMGNYSSAGTIETSARPSIQIEFGTTNTTDVLTGDTQSCATPGTTGGSGNCAVDRWMTHPAFLAFNKTGMWVGKFETTGTTSSNTISTMTVLPGVTPINNVTVNEIFTKALAYDGDSTNAVLDSHMMKNTEWGAVSYLAHSTYGMGVKNIYINNYNNSGRRTGCVGAGTDTTESTTCANEWYSTTGYNGSITGNITGIYDMSGGVWEYVAGFRNVESGNIGSSGLAVTSTTGDNAKYFDVYDSTSTSTAYNKRILGDATGEMGPINSSHISSWYGDYAYFVRSSYPWFLRGGRSDSGSNAGLFYFDYDMGGANAGSGFRLVLAP